MLKIKPYTRDLNTRPVTVDTGPTGGVELDIQQKRLPLL